MEFKAIISKDATSFEPQSADDFKKSLKLKEGDWVSIKTWKNRNVSFHRKYFALLNTTIYFLPEEEKYDRFRNINFLRKELMIMIGHVDIHVDMEGEQHLIPLSISFESMDDEEFQSIYSLSVDAVLKYFLHQLTQDQFEKHLLSFI